MDQQGYIDLPLKVNGVEVKVTPVAPLAQAQKLQEVNDIVQFMQIANALGPQGQMALSIPRIQHSSPKDEHQAGLALPHRKSRK